MEYLFNRNKKVVMTYRWLYILAVFIGPYMTVAAVWNIADIFNALMALPNLIALLVLSNVVVKETKDYFARMKEREISRIHLTYFMILLIIRKHMKEMLMRNSKSLRFFRDLPDGARQETAFSQLPSEFFF